MAVPDPIPDAMVATLLRHFRFPFEFECAMIRGVVDNGWNMSAPGKRNAIWDAQIAFDSGQTIAGVGTITLVPVRRCSIGWRPRSAIVVSNVSLRILKRAVLSLKGA
jgi:hypothetical protein